MTDLELLSAAGEARSHAYAPYSGYAVGAALLCGDGTVTLGCNIENASFSPTVCAERTAFFKAVSEGKRDFRKIAIVGGKLGTPDGFASPCGVCRQVMNEFCDKNTFEVILLQNGKPKSYLLNILLPLSFDSDFGKEKPAL